MNVSEVMVQYLRAAGVRHVFGYPGDPNIEFMEAARRAGLEFVLGRREGTAGLMAEACGFLTGAPATTVYRAALTNPGALWLVDGAARVLAVNPMPVDVSCP